MLEGGYFRLRFSVAQGLGFLTTLFDCQLHEDPQRASVEDSPVPVVADIYSDCNNDARIALYALANHPHTYPIIPQIQLSDGSSGNLMAAMFDFWGFNSSDE